VVGTLATMAGITIMKKKIFLFLTGCGCALAVQAHGTTLRMLYHKDKIVVQAISRLNDTLHFLFDSGSSGILLDSAVADKHGLIPKKEYNTTVPFIKGLYVRGITFQNNNLFMEPVLNRIFDWGQAIDIQKVAIPSDIKIDGFWGPNQTMEQFTVLLDFSKGRLSFADSSQSYKLPPNSQSIGMMYTDEGHPSILSKYGRNILSNKVQLYHQTGHRINTHLLFDTGCHWEAVIVTAKSIDSVFINSLPHGQLKKPTKYFDKKEKVFYWMADSLVIANAIMLKKVKTYYLKTFSMTTFGSLDTYIFIGAPFFKRYRQVYFNFPARRVDFVR
jgi:hypothetical protein